MSAPIPELFRPIAERESAKAVFRHAVTEVQIEISSRCNRRCPYCPVATVDRLSGQRLLAESDWRRVLADLAEIGFDRRLGLSLYNEPLADENLERRIAEARAACPKALIYFYSNGDHLTRDLLAGLAEAGLSEINVSLHPGPTKPYDQAETDRRLALLGRRLGAEPVVAHRVPGVWLSARIPFAGVAVNVVALDYAAEGQDRGGLMAGIANAPLRQAPCDRPFDNFALTCDGWVVPCCQIFPDRPEHREQVIGRLSDFGSLYEAYTSEALAGWRRGLFTFGPKAGPCARCSDGERAPAAGEAEIRRRYLALLNAGSGASR